MESQIFPKVNAVIHSPLRLAVMNILVAGKEAEFTFLKEKTGATVGNLSIQIGKLKKAGYIQVIKQFKDNYPQTICIITSKGTEAFKQYVETIRVYISTDKV